MSRETDPAALVSFNPERAPQAIWPEQVRPTHTDPLSFQSRTGSPGHLAEVNDYASYRETDSFNPGRAPQAI